MAYTLDEPFVNLFFQLVSNIRQIKHLQMLINTPILSSNASVKTL